MKRDLLEYLFLHSDTVELKICDDVIGTYNEEVPKSNVRFNATTIFINDFPYGLHDIISARFIGTEDEIAERISKSPSLEYAMLFTQPKITPIVEIALEHKKNEIAEKKSSNVMEDLETACKASKLTVASVLNFIRINYGVDTQNDWQGIKTHYKQAIEKLTALPF